MPHFEELFAQVNGDGSATAVAWGDITGALSDQTDLQAALDAKLDDSQASVFGLSLLGAADASAAQILLALVPGTNVQAWDADLDALAGLATAADTLPYFTGLHTAALTTLTAFGRSLIDDADATAARVTLGLIIGTDVQAQDAELQAIAGLVSAADRLPYFTGSGTASLSTFTAFARTLVDDDTAADARVTLGLGTMATETAANYALLAGAAFTGAVTVGTTFGVTGLSTLPTLVNTGTLQATKSGSSALTPNWQMNGTSAATSAQAWNRWTADANSANTVFSKSRGAAIGTHSAVLDGDNLGRIGFTGSDGTAFFEGARITATAQGTPGAGSVSGSLVFSTTSVGGASSITALTLNNDQSASFAAHVNVPTTMVVGNTAAIPANTRVLIDRIGTGTLPALPGGTSLTIQGNNSSANNNYLVNIAGATGSAGIRFGDSASASQGRIDYDNATDSFTFFTNAAQAMSLSAAALLNTTAIAVGDGTLRAFRADSATQTANLQHNGTTNNASSLCLGRWNAASPAGPNIVLGASASSTIGTHAVVANNTTLGRIAFNGSDGTAFQEAARIESFVNGTPGAGDMPGALRFLTTPDGSASPAAVLTLGQDRSALFTGTGRFNSATQGFLGVLSGSSGATADAARDELVIEASGAAGISILTPNTVAAGLSFGDPESAVAGQVRYTHSTDLLEILTAAAVRAAIDSTGVAVTGSVSVTGGLSGANIQNTYTPTLTGVTNVSSTSASLSGWIRIGNAVLVFSRVSVTATASGALTELRCSLPVASNFSATNQCVGVGGILSSTTEVAVVGVQADTVNDEATLRFTSTSTAARIYTIMLGYIVI